METNQETRIDLAWRECKTWITGFDGAPRLALLVDVPLEALQPGLVELAGEVEDLRLTCIPSKSATAPERFELDEFPARLAQLLGGDAAELSANFAVRSTAFDLDLHAILHPVKEGRLALQIVWWSDQVFSSETDDEAQFQALARYFIQLQQAFQAGGLFLSPESGLADEDEWVEV